MSKKTILFCIPYAGGAASVYLKWKKYLAPEIELVPIELAGRGSRYNEDGYENIEQAVNDIVMYIKSRTGYNREFCLFGHSMGSLLAYEAAFKLIESNHTPMHLFFSGMYPPYSEPIKLPSLHTLPDTIFLEEIYKLGGTPEEFLSNPKLQKLFIPVLKSDYRIFEQYRFGEFKGKFDLDVTVFTGDQDEKVNKYGIENWRECTSGDCELHRFEGGHFFINEWTEQIVNRINNVVTSYKYAKKL
ncbi:thioesterase II family protein [Paenibacillus glucanolyticus]|uniref:thioesterase II family protein n=1 Tax=Paenibacillus glucanolyticus TaxID=59843 RepID=UPI00367E9E5D